MQTSTSVDTGDSYYVALVFSSAGGELFLNGISQGINTASFPSGSGSGYYAIGGETSFNGWDNAPSTVWFNGYISNVAIYNYPLTATQVLNHYSAGMGR